MRTLLQSSLLVVTMLLGISCGYGTCRFFQDAYRLRLNRIDQTFDQILMAILVGGVAGFVIGLVLDAFVKRVETRSTVAAWLWIWLIAGWFVFQFIELAFLGAARE